MSITINNKDFYVSKWKGFHYGKSAGLDQVTYSLSCTSPQNGSTNPYCLLRHPLQTRLHPASTLCYADTSAVLQDRLSRNCPDSRRILTDTKCFGINKDASLHNPAKSSTEIVKKNIFEQLLAKLFDVAKADGLVNSASRCLCSTDSTGLENHYVSRHFIMRQSGRTKKYRRWTKLLVVADNVSHLIASATIGLGPSTDCHCLDGAIGEAVGNITIGSILADSGFDAEYNHEICHDKYGIRSVVIAINDRNLKYGRTKGVYRRKMKARFPKKKYGQRWQIESVFSRFKRRLGYALTARNSLSRTAECLLRVLTYNLMILYLLFKKSVIF